MRPDHDSSRLHEGGGAGADAGPEGGQGDGDQDVEAGGSAAVRGVVLNVTTKSCGQSSMEIVSPQEFVGFAEDTMPHRQWLDRLCGPWLSEPDPLDPRQFLRRL